MTARETPRLAMAFVIGLVARILLVATSIGTNDVVFKILWAKLVREDGIAHAYSRMWELNHPPLSLLLMHWYDLLAERLGIEYTDVFRLAQVASDVATAAALLWIGRREPEKEEPAAIFMLLPAAMFLSGFHCNTDPMMIAFLCAGLVLLRRDLAFLAGLLFGLSFGIKVVALFAVPFAFAVLSRRRWQFLGGFGLASAIIFLPATLLAGPVVLRNVFSYSGFSGKWGFPALALTLEQWMAEPRTTWLYQAAVWYAEYGKYLIIAALGSLWFAFLRRFGGSDLTRPLLQVIPVVFATVLFFAPGFGAQYLLWPLALLPFALRRLTYWITAAAISAYLFVTYTIWSGGFPWWYADSIAPAPLKPLVVVLGIPLWLWLGLVAVIGTRRLFAMRPISLEGSAIARTPVARRPHSTDPSVRSG